MPNTLSDKVCFITGGGSGNGKAAIKALLEEGAKIFSLEFSAENIEAARREIPDDRLVWR
jgi:NADP-dependent 3-hydroxy acid dehydrogenase YdfG